MCFYNIPIAEQFLSSPGRNGTRHGQKESPASIYDKS